MKLYYDCSYVPSCCRLQSSQKRAHQPLHHYCILQLSSFDIRLHCYWHYTDIHCCSRQVPYRIDLVSYSSEKHSLTGHSNGICDRDICRVGSLTENMESTLKNMLKTNNMIEYLPQIAIVGLLYPHSVWARIAIVIFCLFTTAALVCIWGIGIYFCLEIVRYRICLYGIKNCDYRSYYRSLYVWFFSNGTAQCGSEYIRDVVRVLRNNQIVNRGLPHVFTSIQRSQCDYNWKILNP